MTAAPPRAGAPGIQASPGGGGAGEQLPPGLLVAGVAVLTAVPVVDGKLQLVDMVCVAALPLVAGTIARNRLLVLLTWVAGLWAVGQLYSDRANGLALTISQPVVAAVTVLAIVPAFVHVSGGDFARMRLLLAGTGLGLAIGVAMGQGNAALTDPATWKFGLNVPISIVLLALTDLWWRRGRRLPSLLALGGICVLAYVTDQRSLAGVAVVTALLVARGPSRHRVRGSSVLVGLVVAVLAGGLFVQAAASGLLGERTTAQVAQFGSSPGALLVNIRPEPFQQAYLVAQRPWTGWGSTPRMDGETYAQSKQLLLDLGVVRRDIDDVWRYSEVPGVAAHSALMDSLGRAGVWAVPFWVLVLCLAARAGAVAVGARSSPLVVLWTILLFWDALFSPMTGLFHVSLAAYLALAVTTLRPMRTGS
ncbi:hypothetical protein SAMN05660485_02946 [Blastococcus fimeti]|nr:hypothetical protein SAMN05660485_02946 [Blastococcus fimeti]